MIWISLLALCALASFLPFGGLGVFSDDWNTVTAMAWRTSGSLIDYALSLAIHEARPLLALPLVLQGLALRTFGIAGAFGLACGLLATNAFLFYLLCRRRLPRSTALLAAGFFLLHPADTTHLWLITINQRFAMLVVLLALWSYCIGRARLAGLLALLAFQMYELSPVLLVLAPWVSGRSLQGELRRTATLLLVVVACGLALRAPWLVSRADARTASAAAQFVGKASIETYFLSFPQTLLLSLVKWPARAILRSIEPTWAATWLACVVLSLAVTWRLRYMLSGGDSPRLEWHVRQLSSGRAITIVCDHGTWELLLALPWAVTATMAGAALSFAASPNFEWGHASRLNYFSTLGAGLTLAVLVQLLGRCGRHSRLAALVGVAVLAATFLVFRLSVRQEYRLAAAEQRTTLGRVLRRVPAVPPGGAVLVENFEKRPPRRTATAFTPLADWEACGVVRALYGRDVRIVPAWSVEESARARVTLLSEAGSPVVRVNLGSGEAEWLREARGAKLAPPLGGPVAAYVFGSASGR